MFTNRPSEINVEHRDTSIRQHSEVPNGKANMRIQQVIRRWER